MNNILIGTSSFAAMNHAPKKKLEKAGLVVVDNPYKRRMTKIELLQHLPGKIGLLAGLEPLDREVLEKSDLKVISRCGAGMSNVDLEAAEEFGIKVCNTPDGPTLAVAELTISAILSLLRRISYMDRELHGGNWNKQIGTQLTGKKALVIGLGRIGRKVADLLSALGVKVIANDPFVSKDEKYQSVGLDQGLAEADLVTIHASGDDCIIDADGFRKMKNGSFIFNAGRGGLIDEIALANALREKKIAGAWLDVFEKEPYNGELVEFDNVILTPHVGSYTSECRLSMENEAVDNLISALKG